LWKRAFRPQSRKHSLFTEERISQAHERVHVQLAQAFTEQQILQVLEQVEARVQHAAGEMKAYLDEKTNFLNSSTSAMGKALAEVTRRTSFDNLDAGLPDARFRDLENRIEQVRIELLQELRTARGFQNNDTSEPSAFVPKVLNEAKLTRRKVWGVKLNLGCGHHPLEDYLNVDTQEMPGVDIVADVADLPFEPGEVQEILASHLVARFSPEQLQKDLLPHWYRILMAGGKLVIVAANEDEHHQHVWTPLSVRSALAEAGFQNIEMEHESRRNETGHNETGMEFRISARKNDQ
jgi:SAM-dependent methyltransferase